MFDSANNNLEAMDIVSNKELIYSFGHIKPVAEIFAVSFIEFNLSLILFNNLYCQVRMMVSF